jgi:Icc-related predicted phosphoesterase
MKLLCITDLHGRSSALQEIMSDAGPVDVILLGGDITDFDTPNAAEQQVHLASEQCDTVLAVAGNCDSASIDDRLVELGVSLFGRGIVHEHVGFYGVSAMPPWTGNMYELSENQIAAALERGYEQTRGANMRVMLSHSPPHDTELDRVHGGRHVGSMSVRAAIEQQRPALAVCGHIHESRGIQRIGPTTAVNCGPAFRGKYALAEIDPRACAPITVRLRTTKLRRCLS